METLLSQWQSATPIKALDYAILLIAAAANWFERRVLFLIWWGLISVEQRDDTEVSRKVAVLAILWYHGAGIGCVCPVGIYGIRVREIFAHFAV